MKDKKKCITIKFMQIRDASYKEAKKEIIEFLKVNENAYTSEISEKLRLDVDLVLKVLKDLQKEGVVE